MVGKEFVLQRDGPVDICQIVAKVTFRETYHLFHTSCLVHWTKSNQGKKANTSPSSRITSILCPECHGTGIHVGEMNLKSQLFPYPRNAQEKKDLIHICPEVNPDENCANDGNQRREESVAAYPDGMSVSLLVEEEEKESHKSFEFPSSKNSPAKSEGGTSTPKIERPPVIVVTAVTTCAKLIVKTESCTPKVQANASKGGLVIVTGLKECSR